MSSSRVIFASFIGTAIEFYDFYVYATAAALVIGPVFFPHSSPAAQALSAFVTFGIAFIARSISSFIFGHFGDRIGRKSMLVASLLVMGVVDHAAASRRCCCASCASARALGLAANGGGAALLATEYAPQNKRGWFGMFPQLGPSVGYRMDCSSGWRVPFIVSAVLVALGLYVRLKIAETPAFRETIEKKECVRVPIATLFGRDCVKTPF